MNITTKLCVLADSTIGRLPFLAVYSTIITDLQKAGVDYV